MNTTRPERIMDAAVDGIFWPLRLVKGRSAPIRALGLVVTLPWMLVAGILLPLFVLLPGMAVVTVMEMWDETR